MPHTFGTIGYLKAFYIVILNAKATLKDICKYVNSVALRDANGRFSSVSVLNPQVSAETELTAKPTNKTELQNRSQNYCKIE
ncbi:unnamed protein product [Rhizophagus irregularis]|nr:unnamed protein product [Rhizophagus irregularis]